MLDIIEDVFYGDLGRGSVNGMRIFYSSVLVNILSIFTSSSLSNKLSRIKVIMMFLFIAGIGWRTVDVSIRLVVVCR